MDQLGNNLPITGDDTDFALIDPANLYRSDDDVNYDAYLFGESAVNDLSDRRDLFDYQTKTQNYQSEILFSSYDQPPVNRNFRQSSPTNSYNTQNDLQFNGNIQTSSYDNNRSLELPGQAELLLPTTGYPTTGSYNNLDNFSPLPRYSDSNSPISSRGDYRQISLYNLGQPLNSPNGDHLQGGVLPLELQHGDLVHPENSEQPRRQRRRNKLPNAEYNGLSEDQKKERRKKLASETTQRYTKKQKEKERQLQLEDQMLPISIQENEKRIITMNREKEILEKASERLWYKQFNHLVLD